MQTVDIRSRFEATGIVRLCGAFTADQAAAMRNAMWHHAERQAGLRPADPASWVGSPVLNWQGDVVITHLHVFHARSPDTGAVPRLMLGKEIRRA
jgi:hypothetical protein